MGAPLCLGAPPFPIPPYPVTPALLGDAAASTAHQALKSLGALLQARSRHREAGGGSASGGLIHGLRASVSASSVLLENVQAAFHCCHRRRFELNQTPRPGVNSAGASLWREQSGLRKQEGSGAAPLLHCEPHFL